MSGYRLTAYPDVMYRYSDSIYIRNGQVIGLDGALFPNPDWQAYLNWAAEPNTPDPVPPEELLPPT